MGDSVYQYRPFVDASKQIRILKILPGHNSQPIRITLEVVNLDDVAGEFDALSYTWGSENNLQTALIDSTAITIRYNLWSFLKQQRSLGYVGSPLWTDAVCINQQDIPEKNIQVAKMGDLYRAAGRVLIWLGETSNLSNQCSLSRGETAQVSWMKMSRAPSQFFLDRMEGRELVRPLSDEDDKTLALLNQAMSIVYNPYWKRMWIVQEALLADTLRIILGDELLDEGCIGMIWAIVSTEPDELYRQWVELQSIPNTDVIGVAALQNNPMLWVVIENDGKLYQPNMEQHNKRSTFDFGSMLHFFGKSLCFDRRDRVYSLLGLTQATKQLQVDYACTLEELFADSLQCLGDEDYSGVSFTQVQTLVQALGVSRTGCLKAFGSLPESRSHSLSDIRVDLGVSVWGRLTAVSTSNFDDAPVHRKKMRIYSSRTDSALFLNADFQNDNSVVQSWLANGCEVRVICSLGTWPSMILVQDKPGRMIVEEMVEMYQLSESDNVEHDAYRVRPCPSEIKELLSQRLNVPRLDWTSIYSGKNFRIEEAFITCSALEIMHLYDLLSPRSGLTTQQDEATYEQDVESYKMTWTST